MNEYIGAETQKQNDRTSKNRQIEVGTWVVFVCVRQPYYGCLYLSLFDTIFVRRLAHWLLDWLYPLPRTIQTRCVGINGKIDTSRYAHIRHSCSTSTTQRLPPATHMARARHRRVYSLHIENHLSTTKRIQRRWAMSASHNNNNFFSIYLYRFLFFRVCFSIHTRQPTTQPSIVCAVCKSTRHWSVLLRRKQDSPHHKLPFFIIIFLVFICVCRTFGSFDSFFLWLAAVVVRRFYFSCARSLVHIANHLSIDFCALFSCFMFARVCWTQKFPSRRNKKQRQHE